MRTHFSKTEAAHTDRDFRNAGETRVSNRLFRDAARRTPLLGALAAEVEEESVQASSGSWETTFTADDPDEHALITAARLGDPDAFVMLFRQHRPRVFYVARRYFAPGEDRDDLLQEAMIGFFKAVRDYRSDRGSFDAFVVICVHRQVITFIKTATRQKHTALNRAISLDAPIFSDSEETLATRIASPCEAWLADNSDNAAFLADLWNRCSGLERGVLSMYSRGFSFVEMARELGVRLKSIDNAVWRVKVKAKKLLLQRPVVLS